MGDNQKEQNMPNDCVHILLLQAILLTLELLAAIVSAKKAVWW